MKKLISLLWLIACHQVFAQQEPVFDSEGFGPLYSNPASYGSWNAFSANAVGRVQWMQGSPTYQSYLLNAEADVCFGPSSGDCKLNLGMGVNYVSNILNYSIGSTYHALKVPINIPIKLGKLKLAVGVAPGFTQRKFEGIWLPPQTPQDSLIWGSGVDTQFDMDAGVLLYNDMFYAGYNVIHLVNPGFYDISFQEEMHHVIQGGARIPVGQHHIFPMLEFYYVNGFQLLDGKCYFQFKDDIFSVGVGYRVGSRIMLGATGRYKNFKLGYNMSIFFNTLSNVNSWHAHELRLSYILAKNRRS